jgi:hypothetical protein
MTAINFTEAGEDCSYGGESECEELGTTYWGTFQPVVSRRVENPYPATGPLPGVRLAAAGVHTSSWSMVGKINPKPVKLTQKGIHDIFYHLLNVHMVPSARKAVAGDGVFIGLTFKSSPFVHPHGAVSWSTPLLPKFVPTRNSTASFSRRLRSTTTLSVHHTPTTTLLAPLPLPGG